MISNRKVKRAVITAAGLGTRFLPATKTLPKEMLPVVDMPILHYVVEECIEAGIEDIIIVTRPGNEAIMNYFTRSTVLEEFLESHGKSEYLERYKKTIDRANFIFVHQRANLPYGNGSPILSVKSLVKNAPFAVAWGDDLVLSRNEKSAFSQVIETYEKNEDAYGVIAVAEMPHSEISKYGMVEIEDNKEEGKIRTIIEKPSEEQITSNYAEFGRMVLSPEIFDYLKADATGKGGELWLMDAIDKLLHVRPFYAKKIDGEFLTTGDPLKYLETSIKFALAREDIAPGLREFMKQIQK